MRQWHRWIGICFALFLLIIGVTGVAVQVLDTFSGGPDRPLAGANPSPERQVQTAEMAKPAAADSPAARPGRGGARAWAHWITDVHSGKLFGPVGTAVSILSGLALIFFSLSGVWMYWRMFTQRRSAGRRAFFWKR